MEENFTFHIVRYVKLRDGSNEFHVRHFRRLSATDGNTDGLPRHCDIAAVFNKQAC